MGAVVEHVLGQQVVVAGHGHARPERLPHGGDGGQERVVAGRQAEAVLGHDPPVAGLHVEHVEVVGEPGARVQTPAGRGDPAEDGGVVQVGVGQRAAGQEADGEALAGAVVQHGRADARGGGRHRVGVLVLAVDPEQVVRLDRGAGRCRCRRRW